MSKPKEASAAAQGNIPPEFRWGNVLGWGAARRGCSVSRVWGQAVEVFLASLFLAWSLAPDGSPGRVGAGARPHHWAALDLNAGPFLKL